MTIKSLKSTEIHLTEQSLKKIMADYHNKNYGVFNKNMIDIAYPNRGELIISEIRGTLDDIVEEMRGSIGCVNEGFDEMEQDTLTAMGLVDHAGKFNGREVVEKFKARDKYQRLNEVTKKASEDYVDFQELFCEWAEGKRYYVSERNDETGDMDYKYYATEKEIADDLLAAVNVKINPVQEKEPGGR